ncbi:MAG: hypothetical protein J5J06_19770, partial [Phycisphaerae bacterium]|nr:hypothetical protein [Phycisphaerae bacterium]
QNPAISPRKNSGHCACRWIPMPDHRGRVASGRFERQLVLLIPQNWQFFGSEEGAKAAVIMMSLVQSCREHGINPDGDQRPARPLRTR